MLIEFTVGNYRSFNAPVTFSMVATNLVSRDKCLDENNVYHIDDKLSVLTSAAIYGANASGKTNLALALAFMIRFVRSSSNMPDEDTIPVESFKLSTTTEHEPSFFQIVFIIEGKKYRYGFEATEHNIVSEWLFTTNAKSSGKETKLFVRENDSIKPNPVSFKEGNKLQEKTRPNALFLSVVAQFNGQISKKILKWFRAFNVVSGLRDNRYLEYTVHCVENNVRKDEIHKLIAALDLNIKSFQIEKLPTSDTDDSEVTETEELPSSQIKKKPARVSVKTVHDKYDSKGRISGEVMFDLSKHESEGTRKLFAFAGPLVDTLQNGKVLFIDEMDARLHPNITKAIIKLFNSKDVNPKGAQLIFATHDTNLLSHHLFRRDQIWFTEKNGQGATQLYSLVEYRLEDGVGVRNDASFENEYIRGSYGAVPFIDELTEIIGRANGSAKR